MEATKPEQSKEKPESDSNADATPQKEPVKLVRKECPLCLEEKEVEPPIGNCSHMHCSECLQRLLASEFDNKGKSFLDINCPGSSCTEKFVKIIKSEKETSIDDSLFKKYASETTYKNYLSVVKTIPKNPKDPKLSLADFCYKFNDKERLVHAETGAKFHWVNQVHYDLLGDLIVPYIQQRMIDEFKMQEIQLPVKEDVEKLPDKIPEHVRNNIFVTPDYATNKEKLMLLIQGSGAVRAGQWARALCINDSLDVGAIFGYLSRAIKAGFAVIVFNPNLNDQPLQLADARPNYSDFLIPGKPKLPTPAMTKIPFNTNPVEHTVYVWDHFGKTSPAKQVVIVAHSAGGVCTMGLLREREKEVLSRLKAVAFTDSVHWVSPRDPPAVAKFIVKNAINWVQSDKPLDTPEKSGSKDAVPCVSSGHTKHEYTSASAIESVFKFLISKTS